LSKLFCLPSGSTLRKFTKKCYIHTGLQDNIFKFLEIKTNTFQDINKYCVICIDEMSLKAHLFYNGEIECLNSKLLPACNVTVMKVKGICESWKQPLSYFFVHSAMRASDLKKIIIQAIRKLKAINLKVVVLITDMGSNFYKLFQLLNIDIEHILKLMEIKYFLFLIHLT